jgi:hypothetical protein
MKYKTDENMPVEAAGDEGQIRIRGGNQGTP